MLLHGQLCPWLSALPVRLGSPPLSCFGGGILLTLGPSLLRAQPVPLMALPAYQYCGDFCPSLSTSPL